MRRNYLGFSLIEIAIVLVILAVLVTIVAVPLSSQVDSQRTADTNKQLEQIKEAIYGFAMANGRLPCPLLAGAASGVEPPPPVNGACPTYVGLLPAATLGLTPTDANGFASDAWDLGASPSFNRIRYAVADVNIVASSMSCPNIVDHALTRPHPTGIRVATGDCLAARTLLSVCSGTPAGAPGFATGCSGTTLTTNAPFVIFSMGKNAAAGSMGLHEQHNADGDAFFVSHTVTPTGAPGGEFDDLVTWGSLPILFSRLVSVGKLP